MSDALIPAGTRIGHVHLKVADLERALGFYCGVLGFELTQRFGDQAAFVSAGGYHHHIGLNTWESKGGSPQRRAPPGCFTPQSSIPHAQRLPMRCTGCAARAFVSMPLATMASAKRCTCGTRTHLSLNKDAPISRAVEKAGRILCRPILGGLHIIMFGFNLRQAQLTCLCKRYFLLS